MAARALVQHWAKLDFLNPGWRHIIAFHFADGLRSSTGEVEVPVNDNDSAAQIKSAASTAIRDFVAVEWADIGSVVENNQIIWPDGTRS